jgi:valyl-tRNA synthetase
MGWPEQTDLLKTFYPTSSLITGFDILFFWVARMMMMGIHFMDEVPFKDVYIHALVRDEHGKKMSKSKGNVIDPLTVIDQYGTDAFRYTLVAFAAQGRDIKLSLERVEGYRHFINKLWNAARFSFMHIEEKHASITYENAGLADKWILSRLNKTVTGVEQALDSYKFNEAAADLYKFVWHEFCDWYLEAVKPSLFGKMGEEQQLASGAVLYKVLKETIILLHPFIPFITEEIWDMIPGTDGSVMSSAFPSGIDESKVAVNDAIEKEMNLVMSIISGVRNIRGEMHIPPSSLLNVEVHTETDSDSGIITRHLPMICNLARIDSLITKTGGEKPESAATAIVEGAAVYVFLEGIIDFNKEAERLEKAITKLQKEVDSISNRLANKGFTSKAPAEVVEKVQIQKNEAVDKLDKLKENLSKILEAKG